MANNYRRQKKERKKRQVQQQVHERAVNRFICDELRKFGSGNIAFSRAQIMGDIDSGRRTIPGRYFRK